MFQEVAGMQVRGENRSNGVRKRRLIGRQMQDVIGQALLRAEFVEELLDRQD